MTTYTYIFIFIAAFRSSSNKWKNHELYNGLRMVELNVDGKIKQRWNFLMYLAHIFVEQLQNLWEDNYMFHIFSALTIARIQTYGLNNNNSLDSLEYTYVCELRIYM